MGALARVRRRLADAMRSRDRWRQVLRRREAAEQEIVEAIEDVERRLRARRKQRRLLRREERRPEKREQLADGIEELESALDQLIERLDVRERKSDRAEEALGRQIGRVRRLRARRREILTARTGPSRHFAYAEFNCREGGPVPEYMYPHIDDLCRRILEPMRERFGAVRVNSGHRWRFYNQKIGGATGSYHEYEIHKADPAADCTFERGTPAEWAAFARLLGIGGVGQYATFVHVDTGPRRDWWG